MTSDLRRLRGIVPSLNTPFHPDLSLVSRSLRREVDYVVAAGCTGILAMAVAGEGRSLSETELAAGTRQIVAANGGRVPIIVSVSAPYFVASRARPAAVCEAGADVLLYQAPRTVGRSALRERLLALSEVGPGAIMLRDLDWHGPGLAIDDIADLAQTVPAFQSLKIETVPAGPKYTRVLEATGGALHVCGGWAVSQMLDALARGVHAFMPTEFEPVYVMIYALYTAGKTDAARHLFDALLPFIAFSNQHIDVSIRFFKHLRQQSGIFQTTICRPPVPELDEFSVREMRPLASARSGVFEMAAQMRAEYLAAPESDG